jgi:hypothetical protein
VIFITAYKVKPYLSKGETKQLTDVFAKEGPGPGTGRTMWQPTAVTAW